MKERRTVLCYGDSNTHGYNPDGGARFSKEIRWTGKLQQLLGDSYEVVEEGCNGRTSQFGDADGWINGYLYLRPCLYSHRPLDYVVLMLGTNDLKKSFGVDACQIASGVEILVKEIMEFLGEHQSRVPKVILIAPPTLGATMKDSCFANEFDEESVMKSYELAELYKEIAATYRCAFLNAAEFAPVSEADALHLSEESHAAFATAVYKCLKEIE
ncbi:MAG: SGNH/GDSL hydrolase family protein [Lachnospiraceae bacterium]|nr:SGNH/GDSL hydrolase family protein [Lachnospiraceae bacterium]